MTPTLRSQTYSIPRILLARLSVIQYLRRFWWFMAIIPCFGFVLLVFGSGVMQVIGAMALLWPFSLPARSVIASSKASKYLRQGVWILVEDETLYFHAAENQGFKLNLDNVYRIDQQGDYLLLTVRGRNAGMPDFMFVPIDLSAFGDHAGQFEASIREIVARD